jgi:3',5'-cyclic AMP phosphodiesterase CpdA
MSRAFALATALIMLTLLLHRLESKPPPQGPPRTRTPAAMFAAAASANTTTFWHVTDWHLNLFHKAHGDVRDMCRSGADDASRWPGPLGHFNCDPSRAVAELAMRRMVAVQPAPAFILLGGDNFGHVPPASEDAAAVTASHAAMAELLGTSFPGVPVLPLVGNHDTWPYFAGGKAARDVRATLARLFGGGLGPSGARELRESGHFVFRHAAWLQVPPRLASPGHRSVGLLGGSKGPGRSSAHRSAASAAWKLAVTSVARLRPTQKARSSRLLDHAGPAALAGLWVVALDTNSLALPEAAKTAARQLQWLEETLAAAAAQRAAVLIAGHIAPGASHTDWRSIGESRVNGSSRGRAD